MEILRIEDLVGDAAEVGVLTNRNGVAKTVVSIDFNPDDEVYPSGYMLYTPDDARKLAAALILAADEAEKK